MSTPNEATLMLMLNQVKRIDMRVSMDVASLANCVVRDNNGNLLPFVWTRHSIHNEHENASLLTRGALQKQMMNFIESTASDNLKMLQKVSDPALLVDWVMRTAEHWERRYAQKRDEKYDISQPVLAAMLETITEQVLPTLHLFWQDELAELKRKLDRKFETLSTVEINNPYYLLLLRYLSAETQSAQERNLGSFFWIHRGHHALARFFFRIGLQLYDNSEAPSAHKQFDLGTAHQVLSVKRKTPESASNQFNSLVSEFLQHISVMAGKLLQKKEVCNKAGSYSSNRQRSDVLQEFNNAVFNFRMWVENICANVLFDELKAMLESNCWLFYVIDHTSVPVTLSHIKTVTPKLDLPETVLCPQCSTAYLHQTPAAPSSSP